MSVGFIYVIQMEGTRFYKVGRTADLNRRMASLGTLLPTKRLLRIAMRVQECEQVELNLHQEFIEFRRNGEWFELEEIHLERLRAYLLYCQTEDLIQRAVRCFSCDDLFPNRLKQWGRFFYFLSRRQDRRLSRYVTLSPVMPIFSAQDWIHEEAECPA